VSEAIHRLSIWYGTWIIGSHPEAIHARKTVKALPIDKEFVLAKAGGGIHGRRGIRNNLDHMAATHGPAVVKESRSVRGKVGFLSVQQHVSLARIDAPNQRNVVLFAATGSSDFSIRECRHVGKAKSPGKSETNAVERHDQLYGSCLPSNAAFRARNPLSASDSGKVYLVDERLT